MTKVSGLGHVGISVRDLEHMTRFYTRVLGLTVTDGGGPGARGVFLSAHPETEHHEFVLGQAPERETNAQQISFTVGSLPDLRELHQRIVDSGECSNIRVVNHGIAFGCYFSDPEGNNVEVYWSTGMDYVQPQGGNVDLTQSDDQLRMMLDEMPPRESETPRFYGADKGKRLSTSPGA